MTELIRIVEGAFNMDTLGIKDKVRSAGLSKNFKKPKEEWSPRELEIDNDMIVDLVPRDGENPQHYTCSIPWKDKVPALRNNLAQVLIRQKNTNYSGYLEKKGTTIDEINKKFEDQLLKGYIEEVTDLDEINREDCYYVNYFPVVDRIRDTTKVRIVFDAASKDKFGKSLNSEINKGPNRINDLYQILLRFRQYRYAVQADISEMFLRCRLKEEDKRFHRFYWQGKIWQWTRTLFGNRASPDMSQKILATHAEISMLEFPLAAPAIINDTYMDDTIKSLPTEKLCCQLVTELQPLIRGVDMKIQKFYSNSQLALKALPSDCLSAKVHFEDKDIIYDSSKVLGMVWDAATDLLKFSAKFKNSEEFFLSLKLTRKPTWTKRLILKLSATVYDPTGLIAPFTVKARSILQDLWKEELGWDTAIPEEYAKRWSEWLEELFLLADLIKIPRFLEFESGRDIQIHVFVDASTKVFAACVYVRVTEKVTPETARGEKEPNEKVVAVLLVTSKARVAPTKGESVARLELAGCVIGVRIGNGVAQAYQIDPDKIQYWTDSTNCLYWINSPSSVLKTFVANRVGEIQTESKPENWRHVPTDQNPADIPTRFPNVKDLQQNSLWWHGPDFLSKPETEWPDKFIPPADDSAKDEFKKTFLNFHMSSKEKIERLNPNNYSVGSVWNGFKVLINNTALLIRKIYFSENKKEISYPASMRRALELQIRRAQLEDEELEEVIKSLTQTSSPIQKSYSSLFPFVDEKGILRSKSRLAEIKHIPYNTRFPVILSTKSTFTKLLVESAHQEFEHSVSIEAAKSKLKDSYYIIGLENFLRKIRADCMTCKKAKAIPFEQRMGNLPSYRFEQPLQAFSKTGLDFAGPYEIKVGRMKARPKIYILLFSCCDESVRFDLSLPLRKRSRHSLLI